MDRFLAITADVRTALTTSTLEVYPEDYTGNVTNEKHFARYSLLLPSSSSYNFSGDPFTSGMLMVRLFSEKGYAGKVCYEDAVKLNLALENKVFTNNTKFGKAMLSGVNPDTENEALVMMVYSIPLTHYK